MVDPFSHVSVTIITKCIINFCYGETFETNIKYNLHHGNLEEVIMWYQARTSEILK